MSFKIYRKLEGADDSTYELISTLADGVSNELVTALNVNTAYTFKGIRTEAGKTDSNPVLATETTLETPNGFYPVQVLFDGDSLVYGDDVNPATQSFPVQLKADLGTTNYGDWFNAGVNGQTVQQMLTDESSQILSRKNTTTYKSHILYVGGGINGINQGRSVALIYDDIKTYHQAAVAAGFRTIATTLTAYNNVGSGNITELEIENRRLALNKLIRAGWKDDFGAMGLSDEGADPHIGVYVGSGNADQTYFSDDGVHHSVFGYGYKADLVKPVVESLAIGEYYGVVTPLPPVLAADDNANTLAATHPFYASSEILVSVNNGTYGAYAGTISVGDVTRDQGYWKFKIRSASGRLESEVIDSPAFLPANTQPNAPTNPVTDDINDMYQATANPSFLSLNNYEYTNDGAGTIVALPAGSFIQDNLIRVPVGNSNYAAGLVGLRVKATQTAQPSNWLFNDIPFVLEPGLSEPGDLLATFSVADQSFTTGSNLGTAQGVDTGRLKPEFTMGSFAVAANKLQIGQPSTSSYGNVCLYSDQNLTKYGHVLKFKANKTSTGSTTRFFIGTAGRQGRLLTDQRYAVFEVASTNNLYVAMLNNSNLVGTYATGTEYEFAIVNGGYDNKHNLYISGDKSFFINGYSFFIKGGAYTEWTLLYKGVLRQRISTTAFAASAATGWVDYPESSTGHADIQNNTLHLLDNNSTLNAQTKAVTTAAIMTDNFSVVMDITLVQLNNSANMDNQTAGAGYGSAGDTTDGNINRSGFSFAIVHATKDIRPVLSIVKAQDYATTGNIEIWRVYDDVNPSFTVFQRVYSGTEIPLNQRFTLEIDYQLHSNSKFKVDLKVNGKYLLNGLLSGMNSNYAGYGSYLFQCKGTAAEPAEYLVHSFEVINRGGYFGWSNHSAVATVDDLKIKTGADAALTPTDSKAMPVVSTSFIHPAGDALIEVDVKALPTAGTIDVLFRKQDASNFYKLSIRTDGGANLYQNNAGTLSASLAAVAAGSIVAGNTVVLTIHGSKVDIWANNIIKVSYASLSAFATATAGEVSNLGTAGAVYNLTTYPIKSTSINNTLNSI